MSLDFLFAPVESIDEFVSHLFEGAPLPVALLLAALLGLRHATDPDHLMAVTSLVAADGAGTRAAARLRRVLGRRARGDAARPRPAADPAVGDGPRVGRQPAPRRWSAS